MNADRITAENPGSNVFIKKKAPLRPSEVASGPWPQAKQRKDVDRKYRSEVTNPAKSAIVSHGEVKVPLVDPINAGKNRAGEERVRWGAANPQQLAAQQEHRDKVKFKGATAPVNGFIPPSDEQTVLAGIKSNYKRDTSEGMTVSDDDKRTIEDSVKAGGKVDFGRDIEDHMNLDMAPFMKTAEIVNDVNSKVGDARKNAVNDPNDWALNGERPYRADEKFAKSDDPVTEFTTPDGKTKFTGDQKLVFYKLKDDTVIQKEDYEAAVNTEPVAYKLASGKIISAAQFSQVEDYGSTDIKDYDRLSKKDPRIKEYGMKPNPADGNYYFPKYVFVGGEKTPISDYENASKHQWVNPTTGQTIDYEDIPQTQEEWDAAFYQYRAPDRKTVLMNADGSIPEDMQRPHMEQQDKGEEGNWLARKTNWNVANARAPWQDTAGNNVWEAFNKDPNKRFDPSKSAVDEFVPWFVDANLSSAPYYVPGYNLVAGASAAAPHAFGYNGASFEADNPNWNIKDLGKGTYATDEMTRAQAVGGFAAPILDALAERASGKWIGGIEDIPIVSQLMPQQAKDWLAKNMATRVLGSGITEGLEELVSAPAQNMSEDSIVNYGRPKYQNDKTGEMQYDMTQPAGFATPTAINSYGNAFASGLALGGPMGLGMELLGKGGNKVDKVRKGRNGRRLPDAPEIPTALPRQKIPGTLDRRYESGDF